MLSRPVRAAPPPFRALLALLALAGCTFHLDGPRIEDDFARAGDSAAGDDLASSDDARATDEAGVPDHRSPPDPRPDLAVDTKVDLAGVAGLSRADLAAALRCMNPDGNGTLRSFRLKGLTPGSGGVAGGGEGSDVVPTNPWTICCPS